MQLPLQQHGSEAPPQPQDITTARHHNHKTSLLFLSLSLALSLSLSKFNHQATTMTTIVSKNPTKINLRGVNERNRGWEEI